MRQPTLDKYLSLLETASRLDSIVSVTEVDTTVCSLSSRWSLESETPSRSRQVDHWSVEDPSGKVRNGLDRPRLASGFVT